MIQPVRYLLDTDVLIHLIRGDSAGLAANDTFHLTGQNFRPMICIVTIGEVLAFAKSLKWKEKKTDKFNELRKEFATIDISAPQVLDGFATFSDFAKHQALPIFHDKNDLWIAAATKASGSTLLTCNKKDFLPLKEAARLQCKILDPRSGLPIV